MVKYFCDKCKIAEVNSDNNNSVSLQIPEGGKNVELTIHIEGIVRTPSFPKERARHPESVYNTLCQSCKQDLLQSAINVGK